MRRRTSIHLDADVQQFLDEWTERTRASLGYESGDRLPKGEYLSRVVRQSRDFKEWRKGHE
jgi:hypothetical protein